MRFKGITTFIFILLVELSFGQVVSLTPTFPSQTDTVTITYDATQGNGALEGYTEIYAHMGVITDKSTSPSDWKYVVGEWGTPDPAVTMTYIGGNKHIKTYDISDFHSIPAGETVLQLAFVFRTADGSVVGRDANGGDIFVEISQGGYAAGIISPDLESIVAQEGDSIEVKCSASEESEFTLFINGNAIDSSSGSINFNSKIYVDTYGPGTYNVKMSADNGSEVLLDSFSYILPENVVVVDPPTNLIEGLNVTGDSAVTFTIYAPNKDYIFMVGDFNGWQLNNDYLMNLSEDGNTHWLEITGLDPNTEYRFQYQIEDAMRIADVYSEKILDPWNDPFIEESTYPNLTPYPVGLTTDPVSTFKINKDEYNWDETIDYTRPPKEELVIYEVLLRDFLDDHSYKGLKDTLDYIEKLGVNAIELMPINEFEGNDSWGYNPSFFFAPDKYYGPADELKSLIEECHRRGIAVILDMVLNHAFGQNPQVRMYFDPAAGSFGQPTPDNPWFNPVAKHDFNVGYDYNHESPKTQEFVKRVMAFWIEEYRIDGYRMDLSKGFTQVNTLGDVGRWGQRDASRIAIWDRIGNDVWDIDPDIYMILEHFANNDEEQELSSMGFMLWGNCNHVYNEATMGYSANLGCISHENRNWSNPHLIGFMESHDEERLMYRNLNFGASNDDYDITDFETGLERVELATNFFLTVPGPKMIWQMGELGFDHSINRCTDGSISGDCRLSRKPIEWGYYDDENRKRLFEITAELNRLRKEHDVFHTNDFEMNVNSSRKQITLRDDEMDVVVIGNFGITAASMEVTFPNSGAWYEFYTQDTFNIDATNQEIALRAGEYRLYSSQKLEGRFNDSTLPPPVIPEDPVEVVLEFDKVIAYPNPFNKSVTLNIKAGVAHPRNAPAIIKITDSNGKEVKTMYTTLKVGENEIEWNGKDFEGHKLPSGQYTVKVITAEFKEELNLLIVI